MLIMLKTRSQTAEAIAPAIDVAMVGGEGSQPMVDAAPIEEDTQIETQIEDDVDMEEEEEEEEVREQGESYDQEEEEEESEEEDREEADEEHEVDDGETGGEPAVSAAAPLGAQATETPTQVEKAEQAAQQSAKSKQGDGAIVKGSGLEVDKSMKGLSDAALQALEKARMAAAGELNSRNAKREYDQFYQKTKAKKFPPELMEKLQLDKQGLFNMWVKVSSDMKCLFGLHVDHSKQVDDKQNQTKAKSSKPNEKQSKANQKGSQAKPSQAKQSNACSRLIEASSESNESKLRSS